MRLPRRWVEFLIEKWREATAGGRYYNRTDRQWVESRPLPKGGAI
jgi:hypothetical protein